MRVHGVYLRGRLYTDQVAANAAAARLYAARLFAELGAPVKTECMTLVVNGLGNISIRRWIVHFCCCVFEKTVRDGRHAFANGQRNRWKAQLAI